MLQHQSCLMTRPFPFTFLGSIVRHDGLSKARNAFRSLNAVWRSSQNSVETKLKLYQSDVLSTLLYGSECRRMTEYDLAKLASFHTTSLTKIQRTFSPRTISNRDLLAREY